MEEDLVVFEDNVRFREDLRKRLLQFSICIINCLMKLPGRKELEVFRHQLSKSAAAIGANFEEAQSASYREFVQKMRIALREANESKYWLTILNELNLNLDLPIKELLGECREISSILGSIVSTGNKKLNAKYQVKSTK